MDHGLQILYSRYLQILCSRYLRTSMAPAEEEKPSQQQSEAGVTPTASTTESNAAEGTSGGEPAPDASVPGCPICEFIEAGPCGSEHKVWVACRGEAKEQDVDFVQHCAHTFRSFFGCMLSHQEYYQPFLDAFQVDVDLSQEAIDKANAKQQQPEQQQQQQQPEPAGAGVQQQQQQQGQPQELQPQHQQQQQRQQQQAQTPAAGTDVKQAGVSSGPAAASQGHSGLLAAQ